MMTRIYKVVPFWVLSLNSPRGQSLGDVAAPSRPSVFSAGFKVRDTLV